MKNLIIVTSAILIKGQNEQERLMQTLHTIDSIKCRIPNSEIWLCDSSLTSLIKYLNGIGVGSNSFMDLYFNDIKIIDFSQNERVHDIFRKSKQFTPHGKDAASIDKFRLGFVKNLTESYVLNSVLNKEEVASYDRVFKISGRYFLTNEFNIEDHLIKGKITLKKRFKSPLPESNYGRACTLWSFCTNILNEIQNSFKEVEEQIKDKTSKNILCDIESGLSDFLSEDIIHEIKRSGVVGRVSIKSNPMHYD